MQRIKRSFTIALVLCVFMITLAPASANAQGTPEQESPGRSNPYTQGERALQKLGHRLPVVAKAHGLRTNELLTMLNEDETLYVDTAGQLLYFEHRAPSAPDLALSAPLAGQEFALATDPGAAKTIYLDFDGHITQGTTWNSQHQVDTIVSPPYDIDGDPASFSSQELAIIAASWAVVAEDFAPWNVNVTTIDPGPDALRRSGAGDVEWGVRVVITTDNVVNCDCGGVAYIGAFDDSSDEPAFVFNRGFTAVSQAISHEVGHSMLLAHDGSSSATYYRGHTSADTHGWAPIMGSPYWQPLSQWSQQEFSGASNAGPDANFGYGRDDIAIISSMTNGNNFGLRVDDHGDTSAQATLVDIGSVTNGLISTRDDRDVFAFTATGGEIELTASPPTLGANLDIAMTLRDSSGAIIAVDGVSTNLDASISVAVDAGVYTIEIDGVGAGTPSAAAPTGYSDYGSIGSYSLSITEVTAVEPLVFGDVNCDGRASVADALFVSQYAVGNRTARTSCPLLDPSNEIYAPGADANGSGSVTVSDALMISQCVVGAFSEPCPA